MSCKAEDCFIAERVQCRVTREMYTTLLIKYTALDTRFCTDDPSLRRTLGALLLGVTEPAHRRTGAIAAGCKPFKGECWPLSHLWMRAHMY